jgi:hypothetical protein
MSLVQNHHWYAFLLWPCELYIATCMRLKHQAESTIRKAQVNSKHRCCHFFFYNGLTFCQINLADVNMVWYILPSVNVRGDMREFELHIHKGLAYMLYQLLSTSNPISYTFVLDSLTWYLSLPIMFCIFCYCFPTWYSFRISPSSNLLYSCCLHSGDC